MKLVSVITVNYNQRGVTEELLQSIFTKNSYSNIEVIVVDNGSATNPVPAWQKQYSNVIFIRSEKNLGFAGGNNLAIQQAKGDYIFLINNDTEVTGNLIAELVSTLQLHERVGVVSPKIKYFDEPEILQYIGFTKMNYYTARNKCIGQFEKDNGQYDGLVGETGFAHGAAMMIKKEVIDKAGMMADNFFLYYEEMDWCDKIKRSGYSIWVNTNAVIYHKESRSVGKNSALKEYFMNRNRILYIRRNTNTFTTFVFYIFFLTIVCPRNILKYIKEGNTAFIKILLRAIWWNFKNNVNSSHLGFLK
jgi:GT2 family glycosyltransferase